MNKYLVSCAQPKQTQAQNNSGIITRRTELCCGKTYATPVQAVPSALACIVVLRIFEAVGTLPVGGLYASNPMVVIVLILCDCAGSNSQSFA